MRFALALGGGGLKGAAHLGVLEVLADNDLEPQLVVGTSAGAIAAALYAAGLLPAASSLFKLPSPLLFRGIPRVGGLPLGLLDGKSIEGMFRRIWGEKSFRQLKVPAAVVACDLYTGNTVVYTHLTPAHPLPQGVVMGGNVPVWQAVRASISLPAIFAPFPIGSHLLVDGGITTNVPADIARLLGATRVIAVELGTRATPKNFNNAGDVLLRSLDIMTRRLTDLNLRIHADFVLSPLKDLDSPPNFWEARRIKELVGLGAQEAARHLPHIKALLGRKS
ncbi:patatin-like phospholipase family protein [Thermanaeromonas sp. C210]|uniref:patatin-like phospholipase family protein n=1 Tax=Thermanaeromonas sp. C210 TaxID=2731925 RepID=UPI00155C88EF|nr:patatin-like phospholipase family protein [Thermanaeromonas sp. C210]GFN23254.1 patatin [Thermanaeromonas sp. C210]